MASTWLATMFFENACCNIAATITVYDPLLTFSREVDCIWRRKRGLVTIIFVSQRYGMMFLTVCRLFNPTDLMGCKVWFCIDSILPILCSLGSAAFAALRTWAICGRFNIGVLAVLLLLLVDPAANSYNYSRYRTFYLDDGCVAAVTVTSPADAIFPIIVRTCLIAGDALVLLITWAKTADAWRANRKMKDFRPRLSMLIIRDGTLYFATLFIFNLLALLIDLASRLNPLLSGATKFTFITEAIGPVLISRFILDLRSVHLPNQTLTCSTTVHFIAEPFLGSNDIGDSSAWTADDDDTVHDQPDNHVLSERISFPDGQGSSLQLQDFSERSTDTSIHVLQ